MSHPHEGAIPLPAGSGQTKTLLVTEGVPVAILLSEAAGKFSERAMRLPTPEKALAWCRKRRVRMIYLPAPGKPKQN